MKPVLSLAEITDADRGEVGGKAHALAVMHRAGLQVPGALCIPAAVYRHYVRVTGLGERILMELGRKEFQEMRWEEMWDAALRIRNMFLTTPLPSEQYQPLAAIITDKMGQCATVVRSSAPDEDSAAASFAGLHESYVNVRGTEAILEHVRLVWASLWSDAALLYRQELKLQPKESAMAVVVQEIAVGERSGVAFCQDPADAQRAIIEAVYGLNQGLVDGVIEPDRWFVNRLDGRILQHVPAERNEAIRPTESGVSRQALTAEEIDTPPLSGKDVQQVYTTVRQAESIFFAPQDVEWTMRGDELLVLQSRPITTLDGSEGEGGDRRSWYLTLRRSLDNLMLLRQRIEGELIPAMIEAGERLGKIEPAELSDAQLADEIENRQQIHEHWHDVYWEEFIPFAHGARLFGQVYNDRLKPADPHEFTDLLSGAGMVGMERNRRQAQLVEIIRADTRLADMLGQGDVPEAGEFADLLADFTRQFGLLGQNKAAFGRLLAQMACADTTAPVNHDVGALQERFLAAFTEDEKEEALELLDLARVSWRLRDDDNIHLGRIEDELARAVAAGMDRLVGRIISNVTLPPDEVAFALRDPQYVPLPPKKEPATDSVFDLSARQLVGQPAGPGVARGTARLIHENTDLFAFNRGEILVCDAVDPNMTFVVPLAAAIVERRGGMLIHGAIIAREYGLPCVTGIPHATELIATGDLLTVDGFLGIVTIHRNDGND